MIHIYKTRQIEGFDSCDRPIVILLKLDSKHWFFSPHDRGIIDGLPRKTLGHIFYAIPSFVHYFKASSEFKLELHVQPGNAQFRSKLAIFFLSHVTFEISQVNLKNNTASDLCYFKRWCITDFIAIGHFKLELQSGNAQFRSKSVIFPRVTLKFDGWPWKTIGHRFYATPSLVHHFIAKGRFKLELQSGNTKFRLKSLMFLSRVTLKFDEWPWKTIRHIFYATSSVVHRFVAKGQFKLELQSGKPNLGQNRWFFCDLEI